MSPRIHPSPQNMASMADLGKWWHATQSSNVITLLQCVCVCVCVRVCSEWHVLTEHPYTCWLAVNKREMSLVTVRNIFLHSSHAKPWLWWWSWKKGKQARPPSTSPQWRWEAVGVPGAETWCLTSQEWRTEIHWGQEGGILNEKRKKKSVTQKSHLMLTGLISLATISARSNSHQLKLCLSLCFHLIH